MGACYCHITYVAKTDYCSDLTASNRKHQKQQQLKMLESLTMTNELGEQVSLKDIYDANVSNPVIRRNELMTRMRGFEDASKELEHVGIAEPQHDGTYLLFMEKHHVEGFKLIRGIR